MAQNCQSMPSDFLNNTTEANHNMSFFHRVESRIRIESQGEGK